jgi:hypothetical protein
VGAHADVGGGYSNAESLDLASNTLNWMMNKANLCGLEFSSIPAARSLANYSKTPVTNSLTEFYKLQKWKNFI